MGTVVSAVVWSPKSCFSVSAAVVSALLISYARLDSSVRLIVICSGSVFVQEHNNSMAANSMILFFIKISPNIMYTIIIHYLGEWVNYILVTIYGISTSKK